VKYKTSPGINERSLTFHSATMDVRKYHRLFNGISIAGRLFGGRNWGENAQKFRLGGVPWLFSSDRYSERYYGGETELSIEELYFSEYVMPLRGTQISNKFGQNVILGNIEFRLPFLVYYFPAIKYIGQINGVLFTDFGVAWDSNYPEFWDKSSWQNNSNTGWLMSYGFGPRFIFLGFPWQLDYAWDIIHTRALFQIDNGISPLGLTSENLFFLHILGYYPGLSERVSQRPQPVFLIIFSY